MPSHKRGLEARLLSWAATALLSLISVVGSYGAKVATEMANDVKRLNTNMAVVLEHDKRLLSGHADHDKRIRTLEVRNKNTNQQPAIHWEYQ